MARRLIVTADDLGISLAVNEAVLRAHQEGILRFASLMVAGDAVDDAVGRVIPRCPGLGVGLHLALCCGRSVLPAERIRGLVDARGRFPDDPVAAGMRYFFDRDLIRPMELEMRAQFEQFLESGLPPGHVDGHSNIHVHPVVFPLLARLAAEYGFKRIRLPGGELGSSLKFSWKPLKKQFAEGLGFGVLRKYLLRIADTSRLEVADRVYGLLRSGMMREDYVLSCLRDLPEGTTEMYFHPCADPRTEVSDGPTPGHHTITELRTLTSPQVAEAVARYGIALVEAPRRPLSGGGLARALQGADGKPQPRPRKLADVAEHSESESEAWVEPQ